MRNCDASTSSAGGGLRLTPMVAGLPCNSSRRGVIGELSAARATGAIAEGGEVTGLKDDGLDIDDRDGFKVGTGIWTGRRKTATCMYSSTDILTVRYSQCCLSSIAGSG